MTNLDSVLKEDITLPTKVHIGQATAFPVVIYECESWTIKKVECRRTDAFEPVVLKPKKIKSVTVSTFPPSICHK